MEENHMIILVDEEKGFGKKLTFIYCKISQN